MVTWKKKKKRKKNGEELILLELFCTELQTWFVVESRFLTRYVHDLLIVIRGWLQVYNVNVNNKGIMTGHTC